MPLTASHLFYSLVNSSTVATELTDNSIRVHNISAVNTGGANRQCIVKDKNGNTLIHFMLRPSRQISFRGVWIAANGLRFFADSGTAFVFVNVIYSEEG